MNQISHYARLFGTVALYGLLTTGTIFVVTWATILYSLFS
jgi:hypothetical protein